MQEMWLAGSAFTRLPASVHHRSDCETYLQAEIEALDTVEGAADLPDLLLRCLEQGDCI